MRRGEALKVKVADRPGLLEAKLLPCSAPGGSTCARSTVTPRKGRVSCANPRRSKFWNSNSHIALAHLERSLRCSATQAHTDETLLQAVAPGASWRRRT